MKLFSFLLHVGHKFQHHRCAQSAAALTTITLFALVPLITLSIELFSLFPDFSKFSQILQQFLLNNMVPETASKLIGGYLTQFTRHAKQLTLVGLLLLMGTVYSLIKNVDYIFKDIWGIRRQSPWWRTSLTYITLIFMGPVLLGISLWAIHLFIQTSLGWAGEDALDIQRVLKFFSIMVLAVGLTLAYLQIPRPLTQFQHAVIGGLCGALAFESVRTIFTELVWHFPSYKLVYGTFAILPLFLLWLQISWSAILFCAVLTSCLPLWKNQGWRILPEEDNTDPFQH